jgi:hypothetical protein
VRVLRRVARATAPLAAIALAGLLVAGCGGGAGQNAGEPNATFTVKVVHAAFPAKQAIARPAALTLQVRNTGAHTVPNVAVTLDSFSYASDYPELANTKKSIWIVDKGPGPIAKLPVESQAIDPPGGGQTAYVNTWALGALAPGATQTFTWRVTPIKAGVHTVHFTVAAGLAGKAKARLSSGAVPTGSFTVSIAPKPPATHVDPDTGQVVPGTYPLTP